MLVVLMGVGVIGAAFTIPDAMAGRIPAPVQVVLVLLLIVHLLERALELAGGEEDDRG